MGKKNGLPSGWLDYSNIGKQVPGTRFIAFKVPLKETICKNKLEPSEWFTPANLLRAIPKLKMVVNLTNTVSGRYYDYSFFEVNGVEMLPLKCEGRGTLPPNNLMKTFYNAVDNFLRVNAADKDALIGVHCTHGLNRTGLFICKYMVERMRIPTEEAIQRFQTARGHNIERHQYVEAINASSRNRPDTLPGVSREYNGSRGTERGCSYTNQYSKYREQRQDNGYNNYGQNWNNGDDYEDYRSRYNKRNNFQQQNRYSNVHYSRNQPELYSSSRRNAQGRRSNREYSKPNYYSPLDNCYD